MASIPIKSGVEIGHKFSPLQFQAQVLFPLSLLGSMKKGEVLLKMLNAQWEIGGVLIYTLNKTSSPLFYWAQATPTRYRDRSHWVNPPTTGCVLFGQTVRWFVAQWLALRWVLGMSLFAARWQHVRRSPLCSGLSTPTEPQSPRVKWSTNTGLWSWSVIARWPAMVGWSRMTVRAFVGVHQGGDTLRKVLWLRIEKRLVARPQWNLSMGKHFAESSRCICNTCNIRHVISFTNILSVKEISALPRPSIKTSAERTRAVQFKKCSSIQVGLAGLCKLMSAL